MPTLEPLRLDTRRLVLAAPRCAAVYRRTIPLVTSVAGVAGVGASTGGG